MGKGYFHALLTDGTQIVGFDKSQRNILKDFEEKGDPVALKGCRIKLSHYASDMEVILRPETNLTLSPKKIKVNPDRFAVRLWHQCERRWKYGSIQAGVSVCKSHKGRRSSCCFRMMSSKYKMSSSQMLIGLSRWHSGRMTLGALPKEVVPPCECSRQQFPRGKVLQFPKGGAEAHEVEDIGRGRCSKFRRQSTRFRGSRHPSIRLLCCLSRLQEQSGQEE